MKRLSLLIKKQPVDWMTFWLLLFANSYKLYPGMIMVLVLFVLEIVRRKNLRIFKGWKLILGCWAGIGLTMCISFYTHFSSFNNLFWGMFTYTPILLYPILMSRKVAEKSFVNALKVFVAVQIPFYTLQYLSLAVAYKTINIFAANSGAGDSLQGSVMGFSSIISVTMAFVTLLLLYPYRSVPLRNRIYYAIISFILMVLTGYMTGVLLFICSIGVYVVIRFLTQMILLRLNKKLVGLIVTLCFGALVLVIIEWSNVLYTFELLSIITKKVEFVKAKAVEVTFNEFSKEIGTGIVAGVGAGNYSSRASFITDGIYLERQPSYIPVTPSYFHQKYMAPFLEIQKKSGWVGGLHTRSTINAPFCQLITIYGEGGLISLGALLIIAVLSLRKANRRGLDAFMIGIFFWFSLLLVDNWLAFPTYSLCFWLLLKAGDLQKGTGSIDELGTSG